MNETYTLGLSYEEIKALKFQDEEAIKRHYETYFDTLLPKLLKKWRTDANLSFAALADLTLIAPNTLSNIERGKSVPHFKTICLIAMACGLKPNVFLEKMLNGELQDDVQKTKV